MQTRGRPPKNRRQKPEGTRGILMRALKRAGLTEQVVRLELLAIWDEAVGPRVAARAQPHSFSRGTLVVRAASSTWQHELMFLREAIVRKLNEHLGRERVRQLKLICAGPNETSAKAPSKQARAREPGTVEKTWAADCSEIIDDPSVRSAFARVMAQGLVRDDERS